MAQLVAAIEARRCRATVRTGRSFSWEHLLLRNGDTTTPLRRKMFEDMQLAGLAPKTQECYVHSVVQLSRYFGRSPAKLTEAELREYFLYLVQDK